MSAFDGYVQAAFHGGVMRGGPTFTVVHDAETPLDYGYCDAIAEFFRKGPRAGTSAHAMVGPEKALKLLPDDVVAWAAGPYANPLGWHLEQTGYAHFTRPQWTTPKGLAQVDRAAACLREVHDTWSIPKRWMTDDQLRRAARGDRAAGGLTTHQQVARVLGGTTHTDPEDHYPRDLLLQAMLTGPRADEEDDMPQVISTSVAPGQEAVVNVAPSGALGKPAGAAGWGQAWFSVVVDCFDKPRADVKVRLAIMDASGAFRPAFGKDMVTTLRPGKRHVVTARPGDCALVVTAYDFPVGVCVEYAKA